MVKVCGIDLSGSRRRPTGIAFIDNSRIIFCGIVYNDEEIVDLIKSYKPVVVAIDSPLTLPSKGYFRDIDKLMIRLGYRVLPPRWSGMMMLVKRAMKLSKALEDLGIKVIETHPTSALKSSCCGSLNELTSSLGLNDINRPLTRDERDAIISALVALMFMKGRAVAIKAVDGIIYLLPRICRC